MYLLTFCTTHSLSFVPVLATDVHFIVPCILEMWDTNHRYISVINCVSSLSMDVTSNTFCINYKDYWWQDIRHVCGCSRDVSVTFFPTLTKTGTCSQLLVKLPNMKFDKCQSWVTHYHADSSVRLIVILHSCCVNVHRVKFWVFVADMFNFKCQNLCIFCVSISCVGLLAKNTTYYYRHCFCRCLIAYW
jgi:hypothetical protein